MAVPITVDYSTSTTSSGLSSAIMQIYSRQLVFDFQPFCFFDQFTTKRTELGVLPGNTINFLKYNNLSTKGDQLVETTAIGVQALASSLISVAVREYGNAVSVTEFLLHSSFDDVMSSAAKLLGMDYAILVDLCVRDQLEKKVTNVKFANGRSASTNLIAGDKFTTVEVKDAVEVLKTNNVPGLPEAGGSYVCIIHPHQARGLRDDNSWVNASNYAGAMQIFNGEIGKYEDVRFVETTNAGKVPATINSNTIFTRANPDVTGAVENATIDVYHAYFLGYNLIAHAMALPVEMRDGGVVDFGRQHNLAYYAIEGYDTIQPESGVITKSA